MADSHGHDDHASFAHPAPVKLLLGVFFALVILTVLTLLLAGNMGPFGFVVAMLLATLKATLVMLFFMHMFWDKGINIVAFLSSLLFVGLFLFMTLLDSSHYQNSVDDFPRAAPAAAPAPAPSQPSPSP